MIGKKLTLAMDIYGNGAKDYIHSLTDSEPEYIKIKRLVLRLPQHKWDL